MSADNTISFPSWLMACFQQAVGHELPNQLVAAKGLLRLLEIESGAGIDAERQDYLRRAIGAIDRSHALVNGLADLVRAARVAEPSQMVPLAGLFQELAAEIKRAFADRVITFDFSILSPALSAPPRALRQVLTMLIRQAIQLCPDGDVHLKARTAATGEGTELRLWTNGPALSPEQRKGLFEPFADVLGNRQDRLGLALARLLAERWGGSIHLYADTVTGNTFVLQTPLASRPDLEALK